MIQLSMPAQDNSWSPVNDNTIDVTTLILYPFFVEADANGNSFDIKKEDVYAVHDLYNKTVRFKWSKLQKIGKNIPLKYVENVPNIIDHEQKTVMNIVGHVIGELKILEKDGDPYLFATLRVKGKENVDRVKDGRFSQVSMGFDPITHELGEISWVVNGAIPGAQVIMSDGSKVIKNINHRNSEFNLMNVTNLKSILLSQYDSQRNRLDDIQNEIDIELMLTNLAADGKLYPRDKLRIKSQLSKISDKQVRLDTFNLLSENLRTVIDFGIRARNKTSINWEENLMSKGKGTNMRDLQKIAQDCAIRLKKGHKMKMGEDEESESEMKKRKLSDHEEEYKESEEHLSKKKMKMSEEHEKPEFKKKDLKHCLSIEDKEELGNYLSTFLSRDEEAEEESEEEVSKEEEKEKGKFSKEIKKLNREYAELKKMNTDVLEKLAILNKGNEESRALFNKIVDLQTTSK